MDAKMLTILRKAKQSYVEEGFLLLGVFGSRARGDNSPDSDLDILYRLEDSFLDCYPGWEAAGRIEHIREELQSRVGIPVDMANADALHSVGKKHILPEMVYVA